MGVNDLWQILEPVKQHIHLHDLSGKTIAVDLSLWVCEAQTVKKMIGTVMKPHLRNLFFRISYLMQMDVKLIFVMEGEPPKLKADVINKRNQIRYGPSGKTWSQKTGRSHFKSVLRECLDMLECLGIPWVQAAGEAEAMCAYLNAGGHVDGCLTNDGDAFLYGAQTVYRNFTMNTKRFNQWSETSCYSNPQPQAAKKPAHCSVCSHPGSPKDHERNGCKLCKSDRYCEPHDYEYCCPCEWHRAEHDRQLNGVENNIKRKACNCEGFPFHEVIQEFLLNKDKLVKAIRYQRPDLLLFQVSENKCLLYSMKITPKENNLPESDDIMSFQSRMTIKPTCEIFPKPNSKLNLEISPDSTLPQESISASLNSLCLPEDASCLNTQKQQFISSPRPLAIQQIKAVNKSLTSEHSQPSTSSHNMSVIADLHLSTIDWESTSFSNSPAIQRNTFSHGLKSELDSELSVIPDDFENIPEQLLCESGTCTTNSNKVLDWDLHKISPEEHLLSGIRDLYLQDLPLKERIYIKSSYTQDNVQPDVNLKPSLLRVKESGTGNSSSDCPSRLSKDLPGIHLQNESRNSKVLKGDHVLQGNYKVNTSIPYFNNPVVKTSTVTVGPPNTVLDHRRKIDMQNTQKIVMKKSVCLDRHSSDEESASVFGKAKYKTRKVKHRSQKHNPAQFKEIDHKSSSPKIHIKETEQYVRSYKAAGNEENCFQDPAKSSLSFLQCHKKEDNSSTCLDSPLPLSQRLKLRFQST
ncbi:PREDICTED: flap endonuclease GEN homolog 1 [Propithecus coquereli]|uniref:flap endonuclease GEN homolog 1 n=1 Tax=Propithecus coquereli TaxID=379532 RepID=UPI00063FC6AF|nr:PREDICTED: flap endonuclease GEN homolog 1 [Propithecus coquereli]